MLTIYIARHGQDEDNANGILNGHRNTPLTELGEEQAHSLGKHIKTAGLHFDAIYTSPLLRVSMTAELIAGELGLQEPIIEQGLIERELGVMTGTPIKNIEATCAPDILKADPVVYFLNAEGAETFSDLLVRANTVLTKINDKHKDGTVLLVCSGDIGKMLYASYYNFAWRDVLSAFHFGNSELLVLSPHSKPEDTHFFKQTQYNH